MLNKILGFSFLLLLLSSNVSAQIPCVPPAPCPNPTQAMIDVPTDYASIIRFELGLFLLGAPNPITLINAGKPVVFNNSVNFPIGPQVVALPVGAYEIKARAVALDANKVEVVSAWGRGGPNGDIPVPFERALGLLFNLRLVR